MNLDVSYGNAPNQMVKGHATHGYFRASGSSIIPFHSQAVEQLEGRIPQRGKVRETKWKEKEVCDWWQTASFFFLRK